LQVIYLKQSYYQFEMLLAFGYS